MTSDWGADFVQKNEIAKAEIDRRFHGMEEDFKRRVNSQVQILTQLTEQRTKWLESLQTIFAVIAGLITVCMLIGGVFAFGDGVDANTFFDVAIALGLGTGLALLHLPRRWTG